MNTAHTKSRIVGHLFALASTFGLALATQAGEPPADKYPDVVVQYADLNLTTVAGAKALYARLSAAAERACGDTPRSPTLKERQHYKSCYESTLNRAVEKVGSQQVHTLHAARTDAKVG
jgi:UrcA family protein